MNSCKKVIDFFTACGEAVRTNASGDCDLYAEIRRAWGEQSQSKSG